VYLSRRKKHNTMDYCTLICIYMLSILALSWPFSSGDDPLAPEIAAAKEPDSILSDALANESVKDAIARKAAATESVKKAAREQAMAEELAKPNLKPTHEEKSFASWLRGGKQDIMPTLLERESMKTNNPITFNYLVKPKQMLELMRH
ncbi:hypothetical protein THOM_0113, partial [Trachipleistophora hominis]